MINCVTNVPHLTQVPVLNASPVPPWSQVSVNAIQAPLSTMGSAAVPATLGFTITPHITSAYHVAEVVLPATSPLVPYAAQSITSVTGFAPVEWVGILPLRSLVRSVMRFVRTVWIVLGTALSVIPKTGMCCNQITVPIVGPFTGTQEGKEMLMFK